jgi:uncharacterized membrane protein
MDMIEQAYRRFESVILSILVLLPVHHHLVIEALPSASLIALERPQLPCPAVKHGIHTQAKKRYERKKIANLELPRGGIEPPFSVLLKFVVLHKLMS